VILEIIRKCNKVNNNKKSVYLLGDETIGLLIGRAMLKNYFKLESLDREIKFLKKVMYDYT